MTDREKVIKGLECCRDCFELDWDVTCATIDCPYKGERECLPKLCSAALDLLKEQEAVPVIQREVLHLLFWCCGSCGSPLTDGDKFCRKCGRAVKWE